MELWSFIVCPRFRSVVTGDVVNHMLNRFSKTGPPTGRRNLFQLGCRYFLFDVFALFANVAWTRRVIAWRIQSRLADGMVFLLTGVLAAASVLLPELGRGGLALSVLALILSFYLFMICRVRILARNSNVLVSFGRRRASLHLLRVSAFGERRALPQQAMMAVRDAVLSGAIEIHAYSPLLCEDGNLQRFERIIRDGIPECAERLWSSTVSPVRSMAPVLSLFFRAAYRDTLSEEFNEQCPSFKLFGCIPTGLNLVNAREIVFRLEDASNGAAVPGEIGPAHCGKRLMEMNSVIQ